MSEKPFALVVDDDENLADGFASALELVGFETEQINDSRLTIERMKARLPAVVSLDLQMPHVSGAELLRLIRAEPQFADVKVILVTANERAAERENIDGLADIILLKPITFSQIKDFATRLIYNGGDQSSTTG